MVSLLVAHLGLYRRASNIGILALGRQHKRLHKRPRQLLALLGAHVLFQPRALLARVRCMARGGRVRRDGLEQHGVGHGRRGGVGGVVRGGGGGEGLRGEVCGGDDVEEAGDGAEEAGWGGAWAREGWSGFSLARGWRGVSQQERWGWTRKAACHLHRRLRRATHT